MPSLSDLDLIAVVAASVAGFLVGAVWYSVFGRAWMRAAGIDPADARMSASLLAASLALQVVIAVALALLLSMLAPGGDFGAALIVAVVGWAGFNLAPMAVNHRYQDADRVLTAIDSLHWLAVFIVMALVLTVLA